MTASCPPSDALGRFVEDTLPPEQRVPVEEHVDECDECRSTIAMLARAATAEGRTSQPAIATQVTEASESPGLEATMLSPGSAARSSRPPTRSPLATGAKVGRYVIGDTLGVGGMGVVYTARDPDLNREVAIKVLRPEFARADPDAAKRIMREAQAMARVAHPNVVNVFDVGTVGDQMFVAMERVTGSNLRAWLTAAPRRAAEILEMFIAAGRGLVAAHDAGMVHRDFKPDNVLVGTDGRARVTDFGLAFDHVEGDHEDVGSESATVPIAGTPAYMAPEQHAGGNIDARSDQFSFAVALYEALYGTRPFRATTREQYAEAVGGGHIEPAPAGARVPASLRDILIRALAVKPGDRFPTMAALLTALGRDRGRRPRMIAFGALIALALVGVGFGADWIMRDRTHAVTRTSFTAARSQLDKLVALRTETFIAQSDALYRLPAMLEVEASRDQADFGLGDASEDRARLEHIHDNLRSADWLALTHAREGDVFAIADQKGRLLFGSANDSLWGTNITGVPAIAAAYSAPTDTYLGVLETNDPAVKASGLLGESPNAAFYVLYAAVKRTGNQPRALFVQLSEAARTLDEVGVGEDTKLSIVMPDGASVGTVPPAVIAQTAGPGIVELALDGRSWLAERAPLRATANDAAIAQIVLARQTDVGLSGLFPRARQTLGTLALLSLAIALGGWFVARRRDLTRTGRPAR